MYIRIYLYIYIYICIYIYAPKGSHTIGNAADLLIHREAENQGIHKRIRIFVRLADYEPT